MNDLLIVYVLLINMIAFSAFAADKYLAIAEKRRISEKTLLLLSIYGGSIGAIIAQKIFRHKTRKFRGILWIILGVQAIIVWGLIKP